MLLKWIVVTVGVYTFCFALSGAYLAFLNLSGIGDDSGRKPSRGVTATNWLLVGLVHFSYMAAHMWVAVSLFAVIVGFAIGLAR